MAILTYFAYGSNMLSERLRGRVPSASPAGSAKLCGYGLDFAKISKDQSGKCDLVKSDHGAVWGRLFKIDPGHKSDLDRYEGPHYETIEVQVSVEGEARLALAYVALSEKRDLAKVPYDWYLALVIAGARQGQLPSAYIDCLKANIFKTDEDEARASRKEAIDALNLAGMAHVLDELTHQVVVAEGDS